jgi:hypothetical protein
LFHEKIIPKRMEVGSSELRAESWELGVGSWELGVGSGERERGAAGAKGRPIKIGSDCIVRACRSKPIVVAVPLTSDCAVTATNFGGVNFALFPKTERWMSGVLFK